VIETPIAKPAGFEDTVRPHLEHLYGLAVRLCGNRVAAQDLVQAARLRAFRGFDRLRNRERSRLWLTRILTRCHIDRFRAEHGADETISLDDEARFDLPVCGFQDAWRSGSSAPVETVVLERAPFCGWGALSRRGRDRRRLATRRTRRSPGARASRRCVRLNQSRTSARSNKIRFPPP
jgi:hypothetical protein